MGEVIDFPERVTEREVVVCGCGSMSFAMLVEGEVFCLGCEYIISNLKWEQIDDQDSGETEVPQPPV